MVVLWMGMGYSEVQLVSRQLDNAKLPPKLELQPGREALPVAKARSRDIEVPLAEHRRLY